MTKQIISMMIWVHHSLKEDNTHIYNKKNHPRFGEKMET